MKIECNDEIKKMLEKAKEGRNNAHAPYSNYLVGACLQTDDNELFIGCNIENNGIQSICSERVAFSKALSEGKRNFKSIFVISAPRDAEYLEETLPCGYCRQFMNEFCKPDFKIYTYNEQLNEYKCYTLGELLPHSFTF